MCLAAADCCSSMTRSISSGLGVRSSSSSIANLSIPQTGLDRKPVWDVNTMPISGAGAYLRVRTSDSHRSR